MAEDPKTLEQTPVSPRAEEVDAPRSTSTYINTLLEENHRLKRDLEEALRLASVERDEKRIAELLTHSAVPHVSEPPMVLVSSRPPGSELPAGTSMVPVDQVTAERLKKFKEWKVWAALLGIFVANLVSHLLLH
jgi:hypothetical protein